MHQNKIIPAGNKITEAKRALIMIHGRGGSAEDILSLAGHLQVKEFALLAPEATNNSWYPNSFLAMPATNEPWLSSALALIDQLVNDIIKQGISKDYIYFLGFSQGACLTLEYVTRNATRYGGVVAFTGGLIGDKIYPENYKGDFKQTPIFIGSSDPDTHVPVARVHETSGILTRMNADVTEKVYPNMGHTINADEILNANSMVFKG